jgi:hypothetical protein
VIFEDKRIEDEHPTDAVLLLSVTTAAGDADQAGRGPGGTPADIRAAKDNELLATLGISRARVTVACCMCACRPACV